MTVTTTALTSTDMDDASKRKLLGVGSGVPAAVLIGAPGTPLVGWQDFRRDADAIGLPLGGPQ